MSNQTRTYTKKERNMYLTGMLGQNLIYNIVATGLYFYFQNVICLPAMALGWIFALARVWDAINDPMMGTIVDRTRTKWGKCRPYLIIFPAIIGVVTVLAFLNGNYATATSNTQKVLIVAWAAVSYIAWGMCFTVCDIPLWGITSLMTEDEDDRSKLLGLARIVAGIGGVGVLVVQIAQVVGGIFEGKGYSQAKASQYGFILTVVIMTVIATVLFEFAGIGTREKIYLYRELQNYVPEQAVPPDFDLRYSQKSHSAAHAHCHDADYLLLRQRRLYECVENRRYRCYGGY